MKRDEYLKMLFEDNQTEKEPTKELHEAVLECAVEALSQESADFEADQAVGLAELYKLIEDEGRKTRVVSPFRAAELIAEKLGAKYARPLDRLVHLFRNVGQRPATIRLEDLL